jgi:hypothetical protein
MSFVGKGMWICLALNPEFSSDINRRVLKCLVFVNGGVPPTSHIPLQIMSSKACSTQWIPSFNPGPRNGLRFSLQVCSPASILSILLKSAEPLGQDIDFHFRFTRFCLSTYSVQNLKQVGANGLSSFQQDALNRSVAAAVSFCKLTLELGPAIRDAARYMVDFGFVMISFACIFILQACENFYSSVNRASDYLSDVEAVAQMLKEFAVNSNQGPSFQSRLILAKLQKIDETRSPVGPRDISNRPGEENMGQDFRFGHGGEEESVNDPLWNSLDFFPNISLV